MKIISCENFALQSTTLALTATTDTVVKCGATGKRYYWTGSAFAEYFEVAQGGNITITPLSQTLPKASVSDRKVIDTPFSVEPINNINLITGSYALPVVKNVYARAFIAPYTGLYSQVKFMTDTSGGSGGNVRWAIYGDAGELIRQGMGLADVTVSNGWNSDALWKDSAGTTLSTCGANLLGGKLYYIAIKCDSLVTKFWGFNNLPNVTIQGTRKPLQGFSSTIPANSMDFPTSLTLNGSNQTFFPYVELEIIQ